MRIIDRYLLKPVVTTTVYCLTAFVFLYLIADIFTRLDELLKQKILWQTLIDYYLVYLPFICVQVIPIACMIAVLYVFGNLNRHNEVIALRTSGISIFGLTHTLLVFGTIVSIMVFVAYERIIPNALYRQEQLRNKLESATTAEEDKQPTAFSNLYLYGKNDRLIYMHQLFPQEKTAYNVIVIQHKTRLKKIAKTTAAKAVYEGERWIFYQSTYYEMDENGRIIAEPLQYSQQPADITESPEEFILQKQKPEFMSIKELGIYLARLKEAKATAAIRLFEVELYQRFASSLTPLIIIILAIPFALKIKNRASGISAIGASLFLGFGYYVLNASGIALGKNGILPPLVSVFIAHIIMLAVAVYLVRRLN